MVKITHTNIIVDQFSTARNNPFNKYVHFLTHIHSDHLKGLSNSWEYGTIYCSAITKQLILLKYPRLNCLKQLQLDKQYTIALSSQLEVTVTMFDSNHCAGGVMILFQGYMGNVLYSGDMRFDKQIFGDYAYLYPHIKRNKTFTACSKQIDFLYLDITFLHPKFNFPSKSEALKQLDQFITSTIEKAKNEQKFIEFYIGMDNFGKQEVLIHLADKFQTLVTVSQERYKNISTIGLQTDYFSTDPTAGFIHVVLKRQLRQYLTAHENSMGIILTGWANSAHYRGKKTYAIPYSLHSSYPELVDFVASIRPSYIESIIDVSPFGTKSQSDESTKDSKSNELTSLYEQLNYHEYLNKLRAQYTSKPSAELEYLMNNVDFQKKIKEKLKLDRSSVQINKEQFGMTTNIVSRVENLSRAGAKLTGNRNEDEIQKIKQKLKNRQQELKNKALLQINRRKNFGSPLNLNERQNYQNDNTPLEIEDCSVQNIQRADFANKQSMQQRSGSNSTSKKSEPKSNISSNQKNLKQKQIQDMIGMDQEDQATRKRKWKRVIQEGQVDLFANAPNTINLNNIVSANDQLNSNSFGRKTRKTNDRDSSIKSDKKQNIKKRNSSQNSLNMYNDDQIEFVDKETFEENKKNKTYIKKNEDNRKNKDLIKQNQQKQDSNSLKRQKSQHLWQIPEQRQPNQRTITQYFPKPIAMPKISIPSSSLNNQNSKSSNSVSRQRQTTLFSINKENEQEYESIEQDKQKQQKQFQGKRILQNWRQCSITSINLDYLDEIRQIPAQLFHHLAFMRKC